MFWTVGVIILVLSQSDCILSACDEDACKSELGDFAECSDLGQCGCSEFYVLSTIQEMCIPAVPYNKSCSESVQCQGALGTDSRCSKTTGLCECSSATGGHAHYHEGHCYVLKSIGEPCTEDNQCIVRMQGPSNPLGKCVDNLCSCYQDPDLNLVTHEMEGVCMATSCDACTTVNLSLFAVMMAGTAVLILFIYVVFKIANGDREDKLPLVNSSSFQ